MWSVIRKSNDSRQFDIETISFNEKTYESYWKIFKLDFKFSKTSAYIVLLVFSPEKEYRKLFH